jgi:peptidoglycan/xylan/chitin deacetylase (PgdA/CDA1 family)
MGLVCGLAEAGHEIGLHGLKHDGKLFSSEKIFQDRMTILTRAAGAMGIKGFRSPSLLYDLDLLAKIPFEWDSSIPAWDPFQPQPGGCEYYFPFLVGERCMELPVTLWQDFTLFEELQEDGIEKNQIDAICEMNGLINVIIHPDYMTGKRLGYYRELIEYLGSKDLLFSLPGIIAEWARNGSDSR